MASANEAAVLRILRNGDLTTDEVLERLLISTQDAEVTIEDLIRQGEVTRDGSHLHYEDRTATTKAGD